MDDDSEFIGNNQRYLDTGLAWLRACLAAEAERLGMRAPAMPPEPAPVPAAPAPAAEQPARRWWRGPQGAAPAPSAPPMIALPAASPSASASAGIAELKQAFEEAATADPAPALASLAAGMGLSGFERDMLFLAASIELDPDMPALVGAANGDSYRRAPTFALGMRVFDEAGWDAMAPDRPLRALHLLEVHQAGADSLLAAPLRIDERIAAFIKGINYLDERIAALLTAVGAPLELPPSQQASAAQLAYWLSPEGSRGIVQLLGSDTLSKRDVLATAAAAQERQLVVLPASALPSQPQDAERFVQLWRREAMLLPLALLIEDSGGHGHGEDGAPGPALPARILNKLPGTVFIDTPHADNAWGSSAVVAVAPPAAAERAALWRGKLEARGFTVAADDELARLANEFPLAASRIATLAAGVPPVHGAQHPLRPVWNACVEHTAGALDGLAQRISVRASMDDVALPPHEKLQLQRLVDHAGQRVAVLYEYGFSARTNRGIGLAALLHGESGTGKTMAAEAVAKALSLALFRVDLSAVVSKYIGETSKNLRRVFDAADSGGAVLLFDEADAVFGKRSEVKDSHDRYANIDINYLLTRMEQFAGVTLLATNMKHALDQAFVRRLRFIIGFPFPGVAERRQIWSRVFPPSARVDPELLDLDRLARFALTGGSIFNAALAAAHNAAAARSQLRMPHVLEAIRWELQKIGRPVAENEFVWNAPPAPAPAPVEVPA